MITASLSNYRITPRKMRLVADMIRGKDVGIARNLLTAVNKKAKSPLSDLLDSAIANAKNNFNIDSSSLMVKEIRVDQGYILKRSLPMSRGSAFPLKKRTSHVKIVLAPKEIKAAKAEKKPKTEKTSKK